MCLAVALPTFQPAGGVFQDGAFRNRPVFSAGDMFDCERIEILRGPQSTLSVSDEDANDQDRGAVRGQLLWEPTDALSLRLIGGVLQEDGDSCTTPGKARAGSRSGA